MNNAELFRMIRNTKTKMRRLILKWGDFAQDSNKTSNLCQFYVIDLLLSELAVKLFAVYRMFRVHYCN